jgi:ABC-type Zn2+ transport system substrate-binding protein/surface adhesin
MAHVLELLTGDTSASWRAAGFTVTDDTCTVGHLGIILAGPDVGKGIVAWTVSGLDVAPGTGQIDGLHTTFTAEPLDGHTHHEHTRHGHTDHIEGHDHHVVHPNGVTSIDHVVVLSPDIDRTVGAFAAVGLAPRRERHTDSYGAPMRQVFFRAGEVIVELVGPDEPMGDGPAGFFGLAYTVVDLEATAELLGDRLSSVKDAVQPGRRIATLRTRALGMRVATAFMSPEPH